MENCAVKIVAIMFGASTLALSCAVGRKKLKYPSLDPVKLKVFNIHTVPLDLNLTRARAQKATARNIHGNAPE